MIPNRVPHSHRMIWSGLLGGGLLALLPIPALAQIAGDNTVGTLVNSSLTAPCTTGTCSISGGTIRGTTLFHSFREFSLQTGTAQFTNSPNIQIILARVTGGNSSFINGILRTTSASLFLLNPNGITFGLNARLQVGGSFLATTANSFKLNDGSEFSAVNPTTPLLSVNVPVGLQFGANPSPIVHLPPPALNGTPTFNGSPGRAIALIGGDISIAGGSLGTTNGSIELGAVGAMSAVGLSLSPTGFNLNYSDVSSFRDIQLSRNASVLAVGTGRGITITARSLQLQEGSILSTLTPTAVRGGDITIALTEDLAMSGVNARARSSVISATTTGAGNAGNVTISARRIGLQEGAQITSRTTTTGNTGNISISATESITAIGTNPTTEPSSGILTQSDRFSRGNVGTLTLNTNALTVREGAQIQTATFGAGSAGTLRVNATTIDLSGAALTPNGATLTRNTIPIVSGIFASADSGSTGNAGTLIVNTQQLQMRDGAVIQTSTLGSGDAADLFINANTIALRGTTPDGRSPTAILAASGGLPRISVGDPNATGRGGTIALKTNRLTVEQGAEIAVSSLNPSGNSRGAGNLQIQAETITLSDRGRLNAETASGNGGNIDLQVGNILFLRRNSTISATAGTAQRGGDGGNITIRAPFIISALGENSDIFANAFTGRGGTITITTNSILGLRFQPRLTPFSDITASSDFGLSGTVTLNLLDPDPSRGLVALPTNLTDPSQQISQTCQPAGDTASSSFTASGRGGIPLSPAEPLESRAVVTRWVAMPEERGSLEGGHWGSGGVAHPTPLVEANQIIQHPDRTVELVAQAGRDRAPDRNFAATCTGSMGNH